MSEPTVLLTTGKIGPVIEDYWSYPAMQGLLPHSLPQKRLKARSYTCFMFIQASEV